jgi:hypothetical protein
VKVGSLRVQGSLAASIRRVLASTRDIAGLIRSDIDRLALQTTTNGSQCRQGDQLNSFENWPLPKI